MSFGVVRLERGMRPHPDLNDAKKLLRKLGYVPDAGPGFDALTEACVREFQRIEGLKIDGVVGKHTWSALMGAVEGLLAEKHEEEE